MDNNITNLLPSGLLTDEMKTALEEAWKTKLEEAKNSAVLQVREEFSRRYAEDKTRLVQAADKMFTEALARHAEKVQADQNALKEERKNLTRAIKEARTEYRNRMTNHTKVLENLVKDRLKKEVLELHEDQKDLAADKVKLKELQMNAKQEAETKLRENLAVLENFVMNQLHNELNEFAVDHRAVLEEKEQLAQLIAESKENYNKKVLEHCELLKDFVVSKLLEEMTKVKDERRKLAEHRVELTREVRDNRQQLAEQYSARIAKLEGFVVKQLTKEIGEFETDKRQLAEERVRLMTESRKQLLETKRQFIERASKIVEQNINKQLKTEMVQLREDIKVARENNFGRRIFEAVATEYMASHLSDGSQTKKLQSDLSKVALQLAEAKKLISERDRLLEAAKRRTQLAEERAERNKIMSSLLAPLGKEKRLVMESMLERTQTSDLKNAFQKYLPAVLNSGNSVTKVQQTKPVLVEHNVEPVKQKVTVEVTGNRQNRLAESVKADEGVNATAEIVQLRRLAGLDK